MADLSKCQPGVVHRGSGVVRRDLTLARAMDFGQDLYPDGHLQQSGPIPVVQPGDHSCANSRWKCVSFCFRCSTPGFVTRRATHARGELEPTDIDPLRNKSEKEFHRNRLLVGWWLAPRLAPIPII